MFQFISYAYISVKELIKYNILRLTSYIFVCNDLLFTIIKVCYICTFSYLLTSKIINNIKIIPIILENISYILLHIC